MKKMSDWLVGSFFRTIGRILAIASIGILFYLIASKSGLKLTDLLGISRVYADTGTYSSSIWSLRTINPDYSDCTLDTNNDLVCSTRNYQTNYNLGEYYFDNTYNDLSVLVTDVRLYAYASSTDKFLSSRFYTFNYTICQSNHVNLSTLKSRTTVSQWGYNSSNAATGATMSNGSEVTLLISEVEGTTTINNTTSYCYNYQFSVTPKIDSRFIGFFIHYGSTKGEFVIASTVNRAGKLYSVKSLDVTYTTGTGAVVQDSANQIINNNNQNTQDIINNQNENTQQQIESQKVCTEKQIDSSNTVQDGYFNVSGYVINDNSYRITDYISITEESNIIPVAVTSFANSCFYNGNKNKISCIKNSDMVQNQPLIIPDNSKFIRFSINTTNNIPQFVIKTCKNGNQAVSDSINDLNDTLTDDTINNSDIENGLDLDYDTSQSYGAFSGFLLLPLTWVQHILAPQDACASVNLPLPYMENKYLTLPCMNDFWNSLGPLADLISLVWIAVVGVRIFNGLYLLVVDVTSTEDNAEKLDKVRSWEL